MTTNRIILGHKENPAAVGMIKKKSNLKTFGGVAGHWLRIGFRSNGIEKFKTWTTGDTIELTSDAGHIETRTILYVSAGDGSSGFNGPAPGLSPTGIRRTLFVSELSRQYTSRTNSIINKTLLGRGDHGLFVSKPDIDVANAAIAHTGNLIFDSTDYVRESLFAVQSGSSVLAGYKHRRDSVFCAGNRTNVSIDFSHAKPFGTEDSIPMVMLQFAVCNSSGHFHPDYASSANSRELAYMDSIWVKQLNVIGGTINTEHQSLAFSEQYIQRANVGNHWGAEFSQTDYNSHYAKWFGTIHGGDGYVSQGNPATPGDNEHTGGYGRHAWADINLKCKPNGWAWADPNMGPWGGRRNSDDHSGVNVARNEYDRQWKGSSNEGFVRRNAKDLGQPGIKRSMFETLVKPDGFGDWDPQNSSDTIYTFSPDRYSQMEAPFGEIDERIGDVDWWTYNNPYNIPYGDPNRLYSLENDFNETPMPLDDWISDYWDGTQTGPLPNATHNLHGDLGMTPRLGKYVQPGRTGYWKQKTWGIIYYVDHEKLIIQAYNDNSTKPAMTSANTDANWNAWVAGLGDRGRIIASDHPDLDKSDTAFGSWPPETLDGTKFNRHTGHGAFNHDIVAEAPAFYGVAQDIRVELHNYYKDIVALGLESGNLNGPPFFAHDSSGDPLLGTEAGSHDGEVIITFNNLFQYHAEIDHLATGDTGPYVPGYFMGWGADNISKMFGSGQNYTPHNEAGAGMPIGAIADIVWAQGNKSQHHNNQSLSGLVPAQNQAHGVTDYAPGQILEVPGVWPLGAGDDIFEYYHDPRGEGSFNSSRHMYWARWDNTADGASEIDRAQMFNHPYYRSPAWKTESKDNPQFGSTGSTIQTGWYDTDAGWFGLPTTIALDDNYWHSGAQGGITPENSEYGGTGNIPAGKWKRPAQSMIRGQTYTTGDTYVKTFPHKITHGSGLYVQQDHMPRPYMGGWDNFLWDNVPLRQYLYANTITWNTTTPAGKLRISPWMTFSNCLRNMNLKENGYPLWKDLNRENYHGYGSYQWMYKNSIDYEGDAPMGGDKPYTKKQNHYPDSFLYEPGGIGAAWQYRHQEAHKTGATDGSYKWPPGSGVYDTKAFKGRPWYEIDSRRTGYLSYREAITPNTEVTTVLTNHFNPLSTSDGEEDPKQWDYFYVSYVIFNQSTGIVHSDSRKQNNGEVKHIKRNMTQDNSGYRAKKDSTLPLEPFCGQPLHD